MTAANDALQIHMEQIAKWSVEAALLKQQIEDAGARLTLLITAATQAGGIRWVGVDMHEFQGGSYMNAYVVAANIGGDEVYVYAYPTEVLHFRGPAGLRHGVEVEPLLAAIIAHYDATGRDGARLEAFFSHRKVSNGGDGDAC